jgi:hypothetical protein
VVVARYGQVLPNSTRKEISRRSLDHSFGLAAIVLDIASGKFASLELPGPVPVPLTVHRRAFGSGGGTLDSEQRHVGQLYLFWRAAADSGRAEGFLTAFRAEENIPTVYTCPLQKDAVCDATKGDSRNASCRWARCIIPNRGASGTLPATTSGSCINTGTIPSMSRPARFTPRSACRNCAHDLRFWHFCSF